MKEVVQTQYNKQLMSDYLKMEARRNSAELYLTTERDKSKELMATIKMLREEKEALVLVLVGLQQKYGIGANPDVVNILGGGVWKKNRQ
tara:strand:- start:309 stop:575 length:267 start_codon:yes stop_codon:yes gene_type:complete